MLTLRLKISQFTLFWLLFNNHSSRWCLLKFWKTCSGTGAWASFSPARRENPLDLSMVRYIVWKLTASLSFSVSKVSGFWPGSCLSVLPKRTWIALKASLCCSRELGCSESPFPKVTLVLRTCWLEIFFSWLCSFSMIFSLSFMMLR